MSNEIQKARELSKYCIGRKGIGSVRLEDFLEEYSWQLKEFGLTNRKIINTLPLNDYFALGVFCINNKISINAFCRDAILGQMKFIENNKIDIERIRGGIKIIKKRSQAKRKEKRIQMYENKIPVNQERMFL